jgi:hypothetical protein
MVEEERQWPPARSRVISVAILVSFVGPSLVAVAAIISAAVDEGAASAGMGLVFAPIGVFIGAVATMLPSIVMALFIERLSLNAVFHLVVSVLLGAVLGATFAWLVFHEESVFPAIAAVFAVAGAVSGWAYHWIIYSHR